MRKNSYALLLLLTSLSSPCYADLNKELNKFFDKFGSSSNVDSADIYDGQKAGYMTGGGISVKNRVMNSHLATIDLPRFDAGCGGIDIYAGSFSFINDKQLVNTLKSVGSAAAGYAFLLGLETVSPQVANTIKQLQSWSNMINGMSINSCETASQLVGAVWPKNTMANQQICRSLGGKQGAFSDYVSARHKCSQESEFKSQMDKPTDSNKDLLKGEYNVAWEAIQKHTFLASNKELAELFMTLTGTIVVTNDGVITKPSKINDESFLKTLLDGGSATGYKCSKQEKCIAISESNLTIPHEKSWVGRIKASLMEMQEKILSDNELNQNEKDLLSKTRLPLYKIVNVLTAYKKGHCPVDFYHIADIVAMDLLIQYLHEVIGIVREGAQHLRHAQMYAEEIDRFISELNQIETTVRYYETRTMNRMDQEFKMMQKVQMLEDQIASEIVLG